MTDVEQSPDSPEPKKSLWKRWTEWNGSFLVLSIMFHVLLIAVAAWLVVGIVGKRKEKLKFTAPPPVPAAQEHHVKPAKKTTSSAPPVMKRIASTAINPQIALPEVSMNSPSTDVMSKVMSGMGQSGLGAGASGGGGGLPSLAGLTAFGFKGGKGGLIGHFYDLRQLADRKPSEAAHDIQGSKNYYNAVHAFLQNWDEALLKKYYCAPDSMLAVRLYMPCSISTSAAHDFGVEKETHNPLWVVHYKGAIIAPETGDFRFWASADDFMAIRFDGKTVLQRERGLLSPSDIADINAVMPGGMALKGSWMHLEQGKRYPMEILIGDTGGLYHQILLIEQKNPKVPYAMRSSTPNIPKLPLVQFQKGIPMPIYDPKAAMKPEVMQMARGNYSRNPEPASEPFILPAAK